MHLSYDCGVIKYVLKLISIMELSSVIQITWGVNDSVGYKSNQP